MPGHLSQVFQCQALLISTYILEEVRQVRFAADLAHIRHTKHGDQLALRTTGGSVGSLPHPQSHRMLSAIATCCTCMEHVVMHEAQHTYPHEGCQGGLLAVSEDLQVFSECQVPTAVEADVACDAAKV